MMIAARSIGAAKGYVFIRHEYEPQRERMVAEIESARSAGHLDESFDVEIFTSPGGYILGEETALLECMEGRRGEPRNKPPFPGQAGLYGKPTLINNVETFAAATAILHRGAAWWQSAGVNGCRGLKFLSVSGDVERPDVYLIPMGTTVQQLIELAGGVKDGKALKAFAPGGASSSFLPADRAGTRIDFKHLADAGSILGSGALFVVAEGRDMLALGANVLRFFRNESCGKCVPCRVGSEKAHRMLEDTLANGGARAQIDLLEQMYDTMHQTSICGLGQVALSPVLSIVKLFPDDVARYVSDWDSDEVTGQKGDGAGM
jgi:NADH:ubiquinone oxidoreductase subunit F (NADH-binding)